MPAEYHPSYYVVLENFGRGKTFQSLGEAKNYAEVMARAYPDHIVGIYTLFAEAQIQYNPVPVIFRDTAGKII